MRLSACGRLELGPLTALGIAPSRQEHWKTRLSARHTITVATRFSAGSPANPAYQVLYLSQDHQLALFEVRGLLGRPESPIPDPRTTWTVLPLRVALQMVADLTDPAEQRRIGTSAQELTGRWDEYRQSGTARLSVSGRLCSSILSWKASWSRRPSRESRARTWSSSPRS